MLFELSIDLVGIDMCCCLQCSSRATTGCCLRFTAAIGCIASNDRPLQFTRWLCWVYFRKVASLFLLFLFWSIERRWRNSSLRLRKSFDFREMIWGQWSVWMCRGKKDYYDRLVRPVKVNGVQLSGRHCIHCNVFISTLCVSAYVNKSPAWLCNNDKPLIEWAVVDLTIGDLVFKPWTLFCLK